jgi:hypothetical protein
MPEVDERVMSFVEDVLTKDPGIQLEDLFAQTREAYRSIGTLSKRQFNARYPLQVKRRRALAQKGSGGERVKTQRAGTRTKGRRLSSSAEPRDMVRQVLLRFATDIAAAEERKDLVKVLAGVDEYVDDVMRGVSGR